MAKKKFHRKPKQKTSAFSLNSTPIELSIEKLTFGGDGLSRKDGLIYFVAQSAPGDQLKVQVSEERKNFSRAEIVEITKESPFRVPAPCAVFGKCGGCQWQHISYEEQVKQKNNIVLEILRLVLNEKTRISNIVPSPENYRYRNRIQLKYDGENLGFYGRKSHNIVDINDCLITESTLAEYIPVLREKLKQDKTGPKEKIELFLNEQNDVEVRFDNEESDSLAFSQVNTRQNKILIETVLDWMKDLSSYKIYDLYAGSGNFTFPMLAMFPKASFVAVELSSKSVKEAKKRILSMNLSPHRLRFYLSDVELFLKRQSLTSRSSVLLDPPRTGCSEKTIDYLGSCDLERIFYVSCNPSTLARDIQRLQLRRPWKISRLQTFDMFPQTSHVETLVELVIDSK